MVHRVVDERGKQLSWELHVGDRPKMTPEIDRRQPGRVRLDPALPAEIANRSPLATSWRAFDHAIDARIAAAAITS